ncbi:HlyD family type I secretion periplasmic adaptor subunit [Brevundimonas pishanensis]|uniref:HlyD family type I secretion periplasmic adaptor subunit n=1 Tax=Brevundimonas pishanensis TaxID=2896315 RepID=UPI001FA7A22B|nr:HlyD family type I secretion periplasmic adaptor subunit [Brevundimonas pishanensis]
MRSRMIVWVIVAAFVTLAVWASFAQIDEVAVGQGKVVPSTRSMIIQTFDPGTLKELKVKEGDVVERDEHLVTLDPVQAESLVGEADSRIDALQARAARLEAETRGVGQLVVPEGVVLSAEAREREQAALTTNQRAFRDNVASLERELALAREELATVEPYLKSGAANPLEVLKIRQKIAELTTRISATRSQYAVGIREEYSQTISELDPLKDVRVSRVDQLRRTIIRSPARGVVNDLRVTTIGGVVPAGGALMEIVPLDDTLLVETRISPRDVAFIHPGQAANVKITAFDSSIYGKLPATVERISADSITDENDKRIQYYRVYVRTKNAYVQTRNGRRMPIIPGMVAETEVNTGRRTVMSYLLKPLNKAKEALRER